MTKNSFKQIHKSHFDTKHFLKINWFADMDSNINQPKMHDYLEYIQACDIYANYNPNDYVDFQIIGICNINEHLKMITIEQTEYMYFIIDKEGKTLYVSIGKCHPIYWYQFIAKKAFSIAFDIIYEIYNPEKLQMEYPKQLKGFIGNEDILNVSIHDIENHFILNKNTDNLIWGSMWNDHPFRYKYMKKRISHIENIIFTGQAMRQENEDLYSVSVRTAFSGSIITVRDYNGTFVTEINYNPIQTPQIENINEKLGRKYSCDFPIDVCMAIINFPFINYLEVLKMNNLSSYHVYVVCLLTNGDLNEINHVSIELKKLLENENLNENLKEDITEFVNYIEKNQKYEKE